MLGSMIQDEELDRLDAAPAQPEASSEARAAFACPYLLAVGGAWRARTPSRDHRCTAVTPAAPLALAKQARLCLASAHDTCATYVAAITARGERGLHSGGPAASRWELARTTPVV